MSKLKQLKAIQAEKKKLMEKQKEILKELEETKVERKQYKQVKLECKTAIKDNKIKLRKLLASVDEIMKNTEDEETIIDTSKEILTLAECIAKDLHKFLDTSNALDFI